MPRPLSEYRSGNLVPKLLDLRNRLVRIAIALALVFAPCAMYGDELFRLMAKPMLEVMGGHGELAVLDPMGGFTAPLKLAFYVSLGIVMPYVLWQLWAFVAPGLYRHEKRITLPLIAASIVLFYAGMAFCYFLIFPGVFKFLLTIMPTGVKQMTDISQYVSFALMMLVSFGLSFEVPIVVILLVLTGAIGAERLSASRGYVIVAIFVISAVITPTTDAISQIAMAGPMWLLYEAGLLVARALQKLRLQRAEVADVADEGPPST
ncbi:twin-arginine translocase subunit TatC [bacterium]|nr:MAG: twin-arginine translocase subunit TatC [bacterium]